MFGFFKKKVGIIGYGNMGSAIAERIKHKYQVYAFDKDKNKTAGLTKINIAENILDLINKVDVVLLAVKPQDFDSVLEEIKQHVKDKLIISIAAGVTTGDIEKSFGSARVVRVMPNIEIKIGKGITHMCGGKFARQSDIDFVFNLFNSLVTTLIISEDKMKFATAISGSRLAYFCDIIEKNKIDYNNIPQEVIDRFENELKEAAMTLGLKEDLASSMSMGTGGSCKIFFEKERMNPRELIERIASKKGTTEAALEVLHRNGSLVEALRAAIKREEELARK